MTHKKEQETKDGLKVEDDEGRLHQERMDTSMGKYSPDHLLNSCCWEKEQNTLRPLPTQEDLRAWHPEKQL